MADKVKKTANFMMKITPELKEQAQQRAEECGRSLSNYVQQLIKEDIERSKNI